MKRQPTDWENKFSKDGAVKGLVSKIYKELRKLNSPPKQIIHFKNGHGTWVDFSKEDIQAGPVGL